MARVLVTGGSGFIGAWVVRELLLKDIAVRVFDVSDQRSTVAELIGQEAADVLDWRQGDIRDEEVVLAAARGCDAVVHLAGVLTPTCRDNPILGAQINLLGTVNVFEAARRLGFASVVYTSSAGVFGPDQSDYPAPTTLYGAFKLAGEGVARAYWADHGVSSIGFRPLVVYGPGREHGLSAGPSLACRAAARGEGYVHSFSGESGLIYAEDVARILVAAVLQPEKGARLVNLVGRQVSVAEVLAEIRRQAPNAQLSEGGAPLPIAPGIVQDDLTQWLPDGLTPLAAGIAATLAHYRP